MKSSAPAYTSNEGIADTAGKTLGAKLLSSQEAVGEVSLTVDRVTLIETMLALRDTPGLEYQQLMEIAGVDYPARADRFEVVYCLLSLTRNHRIRVHVETDEVKPVPSVTGIWPVAGWLEREVYDMYGVLFDGNPDLRRILTDYGFVGHPQRKDFPLTGYVELRYSEETKRVAYEPVNLAQDFRTFDFMSPWEGAEYILPGDEKAKLPQEKGAPTQLKADQISKADAASAIAVPPPPTPKVTEHVGQTGAGKASVGPADDAMPKSPARKARSTKPRILPANVSTKAAAGDTATPAAVSAKPRARTKKPDKPNG